MKKKSVKKKSDNRGMLVSVYAQPRPAMTGCMLRYMEYIYCKGDE
jgi:hypothetical protein